MISSPTRKRRRLVSNRWSPACSRSSVAVVLAVALAGCRGPSGGQASTASSRPAGPSTSEQGPTEQGPYRVTATVPVGDGPVGVAVDPLSHTAYVANNFDHTVSVIDEATNTVTATIAVGTSPDGVAVDPGTHTVYVTNAGDGNTVSVIAGASAPSPPPWPSASSRSAVAVDPVTHTVYVTNHGAGTVSVIDGATRTVTATVPSARPGRGGGGPGHPHRLRHQRRRATRCR